MSPALDAHGGARLGVQVRKLSPAHMRRGGSRQPVHVTCAMFSRQGEVVATYNDEVTLAAMILKLPTAERPCF